jgi:hypothetical protein
MKGAAKWQGGWGGAAGVLSVGVRNGEGGQGRV